MSTAECIHGFDAGLCDICYPKAAPERPRASRAAPAPRRSAPVVTARPTISAADQRAYHVTHIGNLESIVAAGGLLADARPPFDVSSQLTRELRSSAEVAPESPVSGFVPFYLDPQATLWQQLREGGADPRWSAAARSASASDFVFLVTTVAALGPDVVLADGDAAGSLTRFATGDRVGRMLVRIHDADARPDAEALAPDSAPWESVQLVGVASERVRDRVRGLVSTRVAVYPPWFVG